MVNTSGRIGYSASPNSLTNLPNINKDWRLWIGVSRDTMRGGMQRRPLASVLGGRGRLDWKKLEARRRRVPTLTSRFVIS